MEKIDLHVYNMMKKKLNYLTYLPQVIANKEHETLQCKIKMAEFEHRYQQMYRMYYKLVQDLCGGNIHFELLQGIPKSSAKIDSDGVNISEKKFNHLIEECARMKEAIDNIEKEKGIDMKQYMTIQEYEHTITALREQLIRTKLELDSLRYINKAITRKDKDSLAQKCQDLQKRVELLEKTNKNKDAIIEQLINVIKKHKNDDQKHAELSDVGQSLSASLDQTKNQVSYWCEEIQKYKTEAANLEKEVAELKYVLQKEEENRIVLEQMYKDLLQSHEILLKQQESNSVQCPESIRLLVQEKKSLEDRVTVLQHDLEKTVGEKKLLIEQWQIYAKDFTERKKESEATIAKLRTEVDSLKKQLLRRSPRRGEQYASSCTSDSLNKYDSGYASHSSCDANEKRSFTCQRCDMEFNISEEDKFKDHQIKCLAD